MTRGGQPIGLAVVVGEGSAVVGDALGVVVGDAEGDAGVLLAGLLDGEWVGCGDEVGLGEPVGAGGETGGVAVGVGDGLGVGFSLGEGVVVLAGAAGGWVVVAGGLTHP